MVVMTMIARVADGLPLAASMQEDEQVGRNMLEYQNQAKQLFRRMNVSSPTRGSLESGAFHFQFDLPVEPVVKITYIKKYLYLKRPNLTLYFIERDVCFLVLCEKSFSKRLAFAYLEDLAQEFMAQYGNKINTVSRPYSFIEFDTYIQKAKKSYMDSRARRNMNQLHSELQDVQRITVQNIEDVLLRGEQLTALDEKASSLATMSQKYKKDAHYLNLRSNYAKIAALLVIIVIILLFLRYLIF